MSQAFISYHRAQRKLARLIAHRIAADGHSVWWDRGDRPGDEWSEAVSTALANAACVVVLWSRQAAASPWILGEATAGFGRNALVSVTTDGTPPPSPFDRGVVVDMQDWEGAAVDVAWIRLRDPVRAKLDAAEKTAAAEAPLPPARPPPVRVGFSSAATMSAPPVYEPPTRSGSPAGSIMLLLALGGAGAAAWYYRDTLMDQAARMQAALQSSAPAEVVAVPPAPEMAPVLPASAPPPAPADPELAAQPAVMTEQPQIATEPVRATAPSREPAPTMTYDWRDGYIPPPVVRSIPAAPPASPPAATAAAPAAVAPVPPPNPMAAPPPPLRAIALVEGRFADLDTPRGRGAQNDIWFAPDRTGYGLFLGVANGARLRAVAADRTSVSYCDRSVLRRTPIPARDLARSGGLCIRSSDGVLTAWKVEGIERGDHGSVLRLRPVE